LADPGISFLAIKRQNIIMPPAYHHDTIIIQSSYHQHTIIIHHNTISYHIISYLSYPYTSHLGVNMSSSLPLTHPEQQGPADVSFVKMTWVRSTSTSLSLARRQSVIFLHSCHDPDRSLCYIAKMQRI
jgi:hypothetical protein